MEALKGDQAGCSRQTVRDDIETLSKAGYDIETSEGVAIEKTDRVLQQISDGFREAAHYFRTAAGEH